MVANKSDVLDVQVDLDMLLKHTVPSIWALGQEQIFYDTATDTVRDLHYSIACLLICQEH